MSGISVATIKSPEFINITSVSPLISKCEVKVFYLGQNRNRSAISKDVAMNMAQTLPGTPIVGWYSEKEEDFRDHGDQLVVDGDGIKFNCLTKPYGFVPTDTKVWFKEFEDTDEFGNKVLREYLMCEGYLWTEQYEEAKKIINEGRPHSMELDEKTLKGHWSTDNNRGIEFFIINDAIFSKLCVLGEDVEPCFEGSSVTSPDVSATFTKDNEEFVNTLYSMMKELKEFTYSLKGGNSMENQNIETQPIEQGVDNTLETPEVTTTSPEENFEKTEDKVDLDNQAENHNITEEFKKNEDEEDNEKESSDDSDSKTDDETGADEEKEDDEKKKSKNTLEQEYALLQSEFEELSNKYASLEEQNKELLEFKNQVEDQKKDDMINSFYMLSDEDKKDVVENKSKYSLEEIESKLAVICVRNKVNFNLEENTEKEESPATIFNLENSGDDSTPAWIKAVDARKNAE